MWTRALFTGWLVVAALLVATPLGAFWMYAVLAPNLWVNLIAWGFVLMPFVLFIKHIATKLCALRNQGRRTLN